MPEFKFTARQLEVLPLLTGDATHICAEGGGRSGKSFLIVRMLVMRALKAAESNHVILRFRFNHLKTSIIADTFPKVMKLCFPEVAYTLDKTDWYAELPNKSRIWFGGLDDGGRLDKILGQEHVTAYLNECSQISFDAREMVKTRIAQKVYQETTGGGRRLLKPRMYYDWNPTNKGHWLHKLFHGLVDPVDGKPLRNPENYVRFQMNPIHNRENLAETYLTELENSSLRYRKRFLDGEAADENPFALFHEETIDRNRVLDGRVPDMVRVVVAVDPSGADDIDNADNDEIGIGVVGLGTDGKAYVMEDCTIKAGPATWGRVTADAWVRHNGDAVIGEGNFGGAMVKFTIHAANPKIPFKMVNASRGKIRRAEPISALYEQGKVCHVGQFNKLEEELYSFSTIGYVGAKSPNRADAVIWAITELFPALTKEKQVIERTRVSPFTHSMGFV
jgi:hypothetical protein